MQFFASFHCCLCAEDVFSIHTQSIHFLTVYIFKLKICMLHTQNDQNASKGTEQSS